MPVICVFQGSCANWCCIPVQDGESWNKAVRPKALGAWNLHELSLSMKELQHFVIFSSIVSSIGHQGEFIPPLCCSAAFCK